MDTDDTYKDRQWAEVFDALSHPTRIMILKALSEEPVVFADLKKKLDIESSGHLQHHLSKLGELIKTDNNGKYTLSEQGRDALLSVETVEKVSASSSNKKPVSNKKINVMWKLAIVLLSLVLITSSAIAIFENSQITSLQSQTTSLQNQIDAKNSIINQLNDSLKWAELTLNIKPLASNYLTTLPISSSNGNITKIYLESAEARYLWFPPPNFINTTDFINTTVHSWQTILIVSGNTYEWVTISNITRTVYLSNTSSGLVSFSSIPYMGHNPLMIHAVVRNDYTPADANPNNPNAPIGNLTSRYVSFVTLTVRLYSQNGSIIQASGPFSYQDQRIITLFSGETKSFDFSLNPSSPYVDHYEIYVSNISSYPLQ